MLLTIFHFNLILVLMMKMTIKKFRIHLQKRIRGHVGKFIFYRFNFVLSRCKRTFYIEKYIADFLKI